MAGARAAARSEPLVSASFLRSLPLFIVSAIFFAVGGAVLDFDPRYGPGSFTLWALLFALGFVAAIGGVASWLLVEEPAPPEPAAPRGRRALRGSALDLEEEPAQPPGLDRSEFGRPTPWVRDRTGPAPYVPSTAELNGTTREAPEWDEDVLTPASAEPAGSISAADALRDLDGIEQELVPRTSGHATPPAPA